MGKDTERSTRSGCGERCQVSAIVRVDERGQMVLPKDVRDRMGLAAGDRLALTTVESGGRVCCLVLVKADELADGVRVMMRVATEGTQGE
ncbi:MAG: HgcAB-associated protein HgcC [Candidatus Bipolaricaulota bacterium]